MSNEKTILPEQEVPFIKRTIDGREYTVKIHFKTDAKETAAQKMKRILLNSVENWHNFSVD